MNKILQNRKIQILLVFLFFFGLVSLFQFSNSNLLGYDSYFHIKYAYLIRTNGLKVVHNFPWLKFTIFSQHPSDLSFLFHLLLIPFTFGNLIFGGKLAVCFFSSLIFVIFFFILTKRNIKYSFLWAILLFVGCASFIFRINLLRPHILSISLVLLSIHFFFERKYILIFLTCFTFILAYSGWEAILLPLIIYLIIQKAAKSKVDFKLLISCITGFSLGILVHPNFPHILYSMYVQNFLVLWYRLKNTFLIGAEMYPSDFIKFTLSSAIPFLLFCLSLTLFSIHLSIQKDWNLKNKKVQELFLLAILSLFSFLLVGSFHRVLEYWVPFAILFSALTFHFCNLLKKIAFLYLLPLFALTSFFIILSLSVASLNIKSSSHSNEYKTAALKLKAITPKNSTIFHTDWSIFPKIFFWNSDNFYIVGMDPTFMYVYNKDLYQKWDKIRKGKGLDKAAEIIKEDFNSDYIFLTARDKRLAEELDKRDDFKKVYEDEKAKIYSLK